MQIRTLRGNEELLCQNMPVGRRKERRPQRVRSRLWQYGGLLLGLLLPLLTAPARAQFSSSGSGSGGSAFLDLGSSDGSGDAAEETDVSGSGYFGNRQYKLV